MRAFANTDVGLIREVNEDDYCLFKNSNDDWLAVVCDGIGGAAAGEVASHIAISILRDGFLAAPKFKTDGDVNRWIRRYLNRANDEILRSSRNNPSQKGMGTTCVGFIRTNRASYIFNVGDSRLYADYSDGLIQMTEDHSVIAQLIREGKLTEEQAKTHAQRNTLTNALGVWSVFRIDTNKIQSNYKYVLICSDGLHGYVSHKDIQTIVESKDYSLVDKVGALILKATRAGGYDNCTVILLENDEVVG